MNKTLPPYDSEVFLQGMLAEAKSLPRGPASFQLELADAMTFVGLLQVAFRHPELKERHRAFIKNIVDQFVRIIPEGEYPYMRKVIEMGWCGANDRELDPEPLA